MRPSSKPAPSSLPAPPAVLRVRYVEPDYVIGTWGEVLLCLYRGPLSIDLLERSDEVHLELRQQYPAGTGTIVVADGAVPIPEAAVRRHASAMIERHAASGAMRGSAVVIQGEGFWASAARSAIIAMFLVVRQPFPQKCFADIGSASGWMLEHLGYDPASAPSLAEATSALAAQ